MPTIKLSVLVFGVLWASFANAASCSPNLTQADRAAMEKVMQQYRESWLRGDAKGVQDTFDEHAVLLPHHGDPAVVGKTAIIAHWWPPSATPTTITTLDLRIDETGGNGCLAYMRGRDSVAWVVDETGKPPAHFENSGTFLNVFLKQEDGSWKILQHMWDDPGNRKLD
jgi:ketosteroid isomerase-like protein